MYYLGNEFVIDSDPLLVQELIGVKWAFSSIKRFFVSQQAHVFSDPQNLDQLRKTDRGWRCHMVQQVVG